ncbi:hypothetical protein [Sorangium sp. So ce385]|uniref:hypothetical protein n=1 Tax=Sorangium sp. So ce385 TaxID=3133308 RepID=UPI003F5C7ED7
MGPRSSFVTGRTGSLAGVARRRRRALGGGIRQRDARWFDIDETKLDGPDFYPGVLAGLV